MHTFTSLAPDPSGAIDALAALGLTFGPRRRVVRMLLDTFDGRLRAHGYRLEVRQCEGSDELLLCGSDGSLEHLATAVVPRMANDIPSGPMGDRVRDIAAERALLPLMRMESMWRTGSVTEAGGPSELLALHDDVHIAGSAPFPAPRWLIELQRQDGHGDLAGEVGTDLERCGMLRVRGDSLTVLARAAGISLDGFDGSPTIALDKRLGAAAGFRAVLSHLADGIVATWEGARDDVDAEFLHDLRVGLRRTRSVLAQAEKVLPASVIDDARHRIGDLAAITGPARDLDAYVAEWESYIEPLAATARRALSPVREELERQRRAAHADLATGLRSPQAMTLIASWRTWLSADGGPWTGAESWSDKRLGTVVERRISRAQATLIERARRIDDSGGDEAVHDVRKAAKNVRYLLECFGGVLHDKPRHRLVRRLKAFQDNLGEHQDAVVHLAWLNEVRPIFAAASTLRAIDQLSADLDARRRAARAEFAERFAAFDSPATRRALRSALHGVH